MPTNKTRKTTRVTERKTGWPFSQANANENGTRLSSHGLVTFDFKTRCQSLRPGNLWFLSPTVSDSVGHPWSEVHIPWINFTGSNFCDPQKKSNKEERVRSRKIFLHCRNYVQKYCFKGENAIDNSLDTNTLVTEWHWLICFTFACCFICLSFACTQIKNENVTSSIWTRLPENRKN